MGHEKSVAVVHEQLVKLGGDGHALTSQARADFRKNGFEVRRPRLSTNPDYGGSDLPDFAYRGIDDSLLTPAVWGALRSAYDRCDLLVGNGKRQRSHALDVHLRHWDFHRSADEEVAWSLHS